MLVPFGETFPYGIYVPFIAELPFGWSDFEHGKKLVMYENDFGNYGTLICYEIAFPQMISRYVRKGADFLVNITNDTWFGVTAGPYQHAYMAVYRAIENRIPIARCANSGFTFFVDQYGRISHSSRLYEKTVVAGTLTLSGKQTFFNRHGPLLGIIGLILIGIVSILLMSLHLVERRKH
jgi:apolipoprotein N-acyltransferase